MNVSFLRIKILSFCVAFCCVCVMYCNAEDKEFKLTDLKAGEIVQSSKSYTSAELDEVAKIKLTVPEFENIVKKIKFLQSVNTNPFFLDMPFLNLEDDMEYAWVIKEFDKTPSKDHKRSMKLAKYDGIKAIESIYTAHAENVYYYMLTSYFFKNSKFQVMTTLFADKVLQEPKKEDDKRLLKLKEKDKEDAKKRAEDRKEAIDKIAAKAAGVHRDFCLGKKKRK